MRCMIIWGVRRRFHRLSPGHGHVAHALRTLAPVAGVCIATNPLPLDLHVLSLPLAFILSQDQTLLCIYTFIIPVRPRQLHSSIRINALDSKNFSVLACTNLSLLSKNIVLHSEAGCKGNNFFFLHKFFVDFFEKVFNTRLPECLPSRKRAFLQPLFPNTQHSPCRVSCRSNRLSGCTYW